MEFNATFLVAAVSFIAFTLIMEAIFYRPVSNIIAKRKAYFDDNLQVTTDNNEKASVIRANKEKELLCAKTEAKNMVMSAVESLNNDKAQKEAELKGDMQKKVANEKEA